MSKSTIEWQTHTNVLESIKALFKGWEDAFSELVKNSLDADAEEVWIACSDSKSGDGGIQEVVVEDRGPNTGMSRSDVETKYCVIGRNKREEEGAESPGGRPYLGKRGTGKFASIVVAHRVNVETVRRESRSVFSYSEASVRRSSETVPMEVITEHVPGTPNGTRVSLVLAEQSMFGGLADVARTVLLRDFAHEDVVRFFVDGKRFSPTDMASQADQFDEEIPGFGRAVGEIWVAKNRLRAPGVVLYQDGQRSRSPSMFGVSSGRYRGEAHTIAARVLGRVDVEPEGDLQVGSADWGPHSAGYRVFEAWMASRIRGVVSKGAETSLRERVNVWLRRPKTKKYYDALNDAEKVACHRILMKRAEVAKDDRAEAVIAGLVARAMNSHNLATLLTAIEDADDDTIDIFGSILGGESPWELRQIAIAATVVKERLLTLDRLEDVTGETKFNEVEAHRILEEEPWVLADDFMSYRSNRTLRTTLRALGKHLPEDEGNTRPDFVFLLGNAATTENGPDTSDMRFLFVELKGPAQPLGKAQQHQATDDADHLIGHLGGGFATVWLIGTRFDPKNPASHELESRGVYRYRATTYHHLIEVARRRVTYLNEAKQSRVSVLAERVLAMNAASLADLTDVADESEQGSEAELSATG